MNTHSPDLVSRLASALAVECERQADLAGWDQPARLYEVTGHDADLVVDTSLLDPDEFALVFGVQQVAELHAHPSEVLPGHSASGPDVLAAGLVVEGWDYPPEVLEQVARGAVDLRNLPPPSEHPLRRETRVSTVIFRDGTEVSVFRARGDAEATSLEGMSMSGRVVRALRRYMGLPSAEFPDVPPVVVAAYVLAEAGVRAVTMGGDELRPIDAELLLLLSKLGSALDPLSQELSAPAAVSACQLLTAPHHPEVTLQMGSLFRPSWEGFRDDVLGSIPAVLREHSPDLPEESLEWVQMVEWADDAYLAYRFLENLGLDESASTKGALKRFNTALLTVDLDPSAAELRNLYRSWLKYLVQTYRM